MRGAHSSSHPCHWGSIPGPATHTRSRVWICEYPYRTVRAEGPGRDCEGCPVWAEIERERACPQRTHASQLDVLHAMLQG